MTAFLTSQTSVSSMKPPNVSIIKDVATRLVSWPGCKPRILVLLLLLSILLALPINEEGVTDGGGGQGGDKKSGYYEQGKRKTYDIKNVVHYDSYHILWAYHRRKYYAMGKKDLYNLGKSLSDYSSSINFRRFARTVTCEWRRTVQPTVENVSIYLGSQQCAGAEQYSHAGLCHRLRQRFASKDANQLRVSVVNLLCYT